MTWANFGPMLGFDVESTGVDVETDRIVTATLVAITPDPSGGKATTDIRSTVINPGVPVPAAAAEIHGFTTERVRAEGKPPAGELDWIAADLARALVNGIPVIIANAPYDTSILDRELRRHGLPTVVERLDGRPHAPVLDPMCIDKAMDRFRKGKRNLTALCETYGVRLDGAHDATFDALAACRVVYRLAQRSQMPAERLTSLYADRKYPRDLVRAFQALGRMSLAELHAAQVDWYVEQSEGLAQHWLKKANQLEFEAGRTADEAERATALADAEKYRRDADGVTTDWPLRPFRAPVAVQPELAA
jgi:DNA polymerase-3 subunit epsilon